MNFDQQYSAWQTGWQSGKESADLPHAEQILDKLEEQERRTARINRRKAAALAVIFLIMGIQLLFNPPSKKMWTMPAGLVLIAANTLIYFRSVLKRQFSIRKMNLGQPSLQFVRQTMVKIQEEFRYVRRSLPFFIALQAAISNLMFIGFWPGHTISQRLVAHGMLTGMILLSAALGFRTRRRFFIRSAHPLLEELRQTERSWSRSENGS